MENKKILGYMMLFIVAVIIISIMSYLTGSFVITIIILLLSCLLTYLLVKGVELII